MLFPMFFPMSNTSDVIAKQDIAYELEEKNKMEKEKIEKQKEQERLEKYIETTTQYYKDSDWMKVKETMVKKYSWTTICREKFNNEWKIIYTEVWKLEISPSGSFIYTKI